jgi:hypothetical protein
MRVVKAYTYKFRINGLPITYHAQAVQPPRIKRVREDMSEVHSKFLQDSLRRSASFSNFQARSNARFSANPQYAPHDP